MFMVKYKVLIMKKNGKAFIFYFNARCKVADIMETKHFKDVRTRFEDKHKFAIKDVTVDTSLLVLVKWSAYVFCIYY